MAKDFRSNVEVTTSPMSPVLLTHTLFDRSHVDFRGSPIDEFTRRLRKLNSLSPRPDTFDPYLGQLILLGAVAAVESYLRSMFRRCISLDPTCSSQAMKREISYAAAVHLQADLLPEALLERFSFTSQENIERACRDLLGITEFPQTVKQVGTDYGRICHLRHCAVHRFGKLGANNAVHLGLDEHVELLEKPLLLNYEALQNAIALATAFVRTFNSFVFNVLISRLPTTSLTGDYSHDRPLFVQYYSLFQDRESIPRSPPPKDAYQAFVRDRTAFHASRARQQRQNN